MKNPYSKEDLREEVVPGPITLLVGITTFILFLVVPLILSLSSFDLALSKPEQGKSFRSVLRDIDSAFSDATVFQQWRERDQSILSCGLREGNSRVVMGGQGTLHYRPDIDSVIGKGPFYREPTSVARAPGGTPWQDPLPVILEFSDQLRERGIELLVVPVPTKSMKVSVRGINHDSVPAFWHLMKERISEAGITFVDLMPALEGAEPFLDQDTHWSSGAVQKAAVLIADAAALPKGGLVTGMREVERENRGDLVDMLGLGEADGCFPEESQPLVQVIDAELGNPVAPNPESPYALLGDSFVNIYDDPSLGFGESGEERIGAGLASHLSGQSGLQFHVIAINGGGASGARKAFAALPLDVVAKKKKVIWVFSARDLLLAEIPGRRAGVRWERVEFNPRSRSGSVRPDVMTLTGVVHDRSRIGDPLETAYDSAIYSVLVGEIAMESGEYSEGEAFVFLWAFQDRTLASTAGLKKGRRYRFTLVPFPSSGAISHATQLDDLFRQDLPRYFAESVEPVE
ncbi:MAG: hypothetical protein P1U68_00950 [Verrucomicrobiales bacterium]|nr:hypothetical protein [Verrucomicrobiales bacterium]